ncbi:hypothetical protein GCM10009078_16800 [Cupriavidus gilardii]
MRQFPAVAEVGDQPRLDVVAVGQLEKRFPRDWGHDIRDGLSNQQGFAVPDITHECGGRHAPEQLKWRIRIHRAAGQGLRV